MTSPPYNIGIAYSKYSDDLAREKYLEWSVAWAAEALNLDGNVNPSHG